MPRRGNRIAILADASIENIVQRGMILEASGLPPSKVAERLCMAGQSWTRIRDLIALREVDIPPNERAQVEACIEYVRQHRRFGDTFEPVGPIVRRVWGRGMRNTMLRDKTERKRLDQFEHAIGVITQCCASADDVAIPPLSDDLSKSVERDLQAAIAGLRRFERKIKRGRVRI